MSSTTDLVKEVPIRRSGRKTDRPHGKHLDSDLSDKNKKKRDKAAARQREVTHISVPVLHSKRSKNSQVSRGFMILNVASTFQCNVLAIFNVVSTFHCNVLALITTNLYSC